MIRSIKALACIILASLSLHIKSNQPITVYAHGFNNHPGRFQERNAIYAPKGSSPIIVNFKYRLVSFGTVGERTIIQKVGDKKNNPMSLIAFSQGTTAAIHYLANKDDCSNIQSIFLIAPVADPVEVVRNRFIFKYLYIPRWLGKKILSWKFPHYDPAVAPPIEQIKNIKNLSKECPIIIMHGKNDKTSQWEQGYLLAKKFYESGYPVYFIEHEGGHNQPYNQNHQQKIDKNYCKLERKEISKIIHAIYKKHGLKYNSPTYTNPEEYSFKMQQSRLEEQYKQRKKFLSFLTF